MKKQIKFLLDTNICIFILRGKEEVIDRLLQVGVESCAISEISVAELYYGLEFAKDDKSQYDLIERFCNRLTQIPITGSLKEYAKQKAILRRDGKLIDDLDLFIGATAITNDLILVTENVKHFQRLPLKIENWVKR